MCARKCVCVHVRVCMPCEVALCMFSGINHGHTHHHPTLTQRFQKPVEDRVGTRGAGYDHISSAVQASRHQPTDQQTSDFHSEQHRPDQTGPAVRVQHKQSTTTRPFQQSADGKRGEVPELGPEAKPDPQFQSLTVTYCKVVTNTHNTQQINISTYS